MTGRWGGKWRGGRPPCCHCERSFVAHALSVPRRDSSRRLLTRWKALQVSTRVSIRHALCSARGASACATSEAARSTVAGQSLALTSGARDDWTARSGTVLRTSSPATLPTTTRSSRIPAFRGEGSAVQILMEARRNSRSLVAALARDDRAVGMRVAWWTSSAWFRKHDACLTIGSIRLSLDWGGLEVREFLVELFHDIAGGIIRTRRLARGPEDA
jgi:hypothetical protein